MLTIDYKVLLKVHPVSYYGSLTVDRHEPPDRSTNVSAKHHDAGGQTREYDVCPGKRGSRFSRLSPRLSHRSPSQTVNVLTTPDDVEIKVHVNALTIVLFPHKTTGASPQTRPAQNWSVIALVLQPSPSFA